MDEHPPAEPRSLKHCPCDLFGLAGVVFLLCLLLGGPMFVESPASFWAAASQVESSCPLHLDPENARQSASAPIRLSRVQTGAERWQAAFVGESMALVPALRPLAALPREHFVVADAPPPLLPGHHGPAAFALPPPLA